MYHSELTSYRGPSSNCCYLGHVKKLDDDDDDDEKAKNSNFITLSVARWQHRTARRQQSNQIAMSGDNKLTFDPPTNLLELTLNLIESPVVTPHLP